LRIANHATYHGLSLNVDMDLEPFSRINPCGYEGLAVTQMHDLRGVGKIETDKIGTDDINTIGEKLVAHLQRNLNATQ
jgi:lipoyl(octanoyl) transferase